MLEKEIKIIAPSLTGKEESILIKNERFLKKGDESQINIYYKGLNKDNLSTISEVIDIALLEEIKNFSQFSLRTRLTNNEEAFIIIKASNENVINGNERREINYKIDPQDFHLIDSILSTRYSVDSKWNRTRVIYESEFLALTVDNNSGYGIIGEIEILEENDKYKSIQDLINLIQGTECRLLEVSRVNEWYKIYCTMWERFYLTGKTFKDFEDTSYLL